MNKLLQIEFIKTPIDNSQNISGLKRFWLNIYHMLKSREKYFLQIWKHGTDTEILFELIFCILTPQSKATVCWQAAQALSAISLKDMNIKVILDITKHIRFHNRKAQYIMEAINYFTVDEILKIRSYLETFDNIYNLREWLVNNIKGIGYKESGHFLRNIGIGCKLAILDRHILRNLKLYNVIDVIPQSLTRKTYFTIENKMQNFAKKINIPMCHLDLLLWCKSTGGIFK
jgi:N-glycosylase/DNA lyase